MVVSTSTNSRIKTIDDIRALHRALLQVVRLACFSRVPSDDVQRLVAFVTRVALGKTACTARPAASCYSIICWRRNVAGASRAVGCRSSFAILRELGRWACATFGTVAKARASTSVTRRSRMSDRAHSIRHARFVLGRVAIWVA